MSGRSENTTQGRAQKVQRLSELLARRDQLGTTWAEHISHGLPDAGRLTIDLMVAEAALADGWPHLAEDWSGVWPDSCHSLSDLLRAG